MKWKFDSSIIAHAGWEMILMRAGFAVLLFWSLPASLELNGQPYPSGLAHWVDLTFLSAPGVWGGLLGVTLVALTFYVIGIANWLALAWLAFVTIASGTLENSQGAINHSNQPFALMVLAQWMVCSWQWLQQPGLRGFFGPADLSAQRLLLQWLKIAFVACYVTSAVTKIDRTDGKWIWRTPNLATQVIKTNADHYYTTGEHPSALSEALPGLMEQHPNVTRFLVGPALILELFAFVMLIGRLPALFWGLGLIAMHEGISVLMELHFELWQLLLLVCFVNPAYWLWRAVARRQ